VHDTVHSPEERISAAREGKSEADPPDMSWVVEVAICAGLEIIGELRAGRILRAASRSKKADDLAPARARLSLEGGVPNKMSFSGDFNLPAVFLGGGEPTGHGGLQLIALQSAEITKGRAP
jgi:hypothetical protein